MTKPSFNEEEYYWKTGTLCVIGIDEVGRGAFAGPIVAAAVVYKPNFYNPYLDEVNDSKLLSPNTRERLSRDIKKHALCFAVESIELPIINKLGIGTANKMVFRKVLKNILLQLNESNYFILADGLRTKRLPGGFRKQKAIIKGDQKSLTIASASIIAKVYRDEIMRKAGNDFPVYGFARNKGYGTADHRQALMINGISKFHRKSFIKLLPNAVGQL